MCIKAALIIKLHETLKQADGNTAATEIFGF